MKWTLSLEARFLNFVEKHDGGCWLWKGYVAKDGYTRFKVNRQSIPAHRFSYELARGPIPDGLELDHLCRIRHCVNPEHLEAVTHQENQRRGLRGELLTHCPRNHEYTAENTYYPPRGVRVCRMCKTAENRAYKARKRLERALVS